MILVDSNILIDVLGQGQYWREWSIGQISVLAADDKLAVNQIVCAEVAPKLGSLAAFNDWLATFAIDLDYFDNEGAFVAGVAFDRYRARRGNGQPGLRMVLADFFIGGHAQVAGAGILTRDPRFYRTYFPTVPLITPDRAES